MDQALLLLVYAPSLTPRVVVYLIAVGRAELQMVVGAVDSAIRRVSFGSWQSLWWIHLIDELDLLRSNVGRLEDRVDWVIARRGRSSSAGTVAAANLALARAGMITVEELDSWFREVHPAWRPTYFAAFRALRDHDASSIPDRAWNALRREPLPAVWILDA